MNTTVVILAAGLGTRMKSKQAKVLHRAGGLPLVEHVVRAAKAVADPKNIIVVTGHQAETVESALAYHGVRFVRQTEQRGTGHAVMQAAPLAAREEGDLMVLLGDAPLLTAETLVRLHDQQESSGAAGTLISTTVANPAGYGRIVRDDRGDVIAIVEQKAATPDQLRISEINSGIFCLRADLLWKHIDDIAPNPVSGEYYLTDIFEILTKLGHRMGAMHLNDSSELLGINTRVELAEADAILRRRKRHALMLEGVTIEQPESVAIDMDVEVGQDTVIEPHVRLLGATKIGSDCRIGAGSILENMTLAESVTILPYCVLSDSRTASRALIGPFSRFRPNTDIGEAAEVGNFAEFKNTKLAAGAKAHHVGYLGDTDIGEKVNIGAGTIVCNYDGVKKHRTTIGAGVFVGSNSTLVAPVTLGNDSYVAAGSVITDEVPPDALALGRARQTNKHEWAAKRRANYKKT